MKSLLKHLTFITTIFILIVGVPLYSFAYTEAVYEPGYGADLQHYVRDSSGRVSLVQDTAAKVLKSDIPRVYDNWVACDGVLENARLFDYYYGSTILVPEDSPQFTEGTVIFDYDLDSLDGFNSISFNVGVFGDIDNLTSDIESQRYYDLVASVDGVPVDLPFVLSYVQSNTDRTYRHDGIDFSWRVIRFNVYLDRVYSFDTLNIKFHLKTYLPYANGETFTYYFGASDMTVQVMERDDWVTNIAKDVVDIGTKLDDTNTQLGIIGDTANDIKDQVTEAVDVLTQELTPEQQQKVDEVMSSMQTRQEVEEEVIGDVNNIFESLDNLGYDPFDDAYKDAYEDDINSLFLSPFQSFWTSFWAHPFIMAFILIAIAFATAGFLLYGVH